MRGLSAVAAVFVISCLLSFTSAGIAKRDTIVDDIKDSIGDALDDALGKEKTLMEEIEDFKIEDLDKTKYCIQSSSCLEPLQFCDASVYKVYGTCKFHAWFWIAVGVGICATFGSCLTTLLCCLCKCR